MNVYCEAKSAVAAVRVTLTVPEPVRVAEVPVMISAAAGEKLPLTVKLLLEAIVKLPVLATVPLMVNALNVGALLIVIVVAEDAKVTVPELGAHAALTVNVLLIVTVTAAAVTAAVIFNLS